MEFGGVKRVGRWREDLDSIEAEGTRFFAGILQAIPKYKRPAPGFFYEAYGNGFLDHRLNVSGVGSDKGLPCHRGLVSASQARELAF